MLPKLSAINKNRRIVFIVATNHIERFDVAIRRPGRFDRLIQILPPKISAKLNKEEWSALKAHLKKHRVEIKSISQEKIGPADLTYAEFDTLNIKLLKLGNRHALEEAIKEALSRCTMNLEIEVEQNVKRTWKQICEEQKKFIRLT
jgi:ATP-dependent 26S proteasome regulatory subunit